MREITVTYLVDDDEYKRLEKILEEYKKQGANLTNEKLFEHIMITGSKHDRNKKFKFHEWKLGLRDNFK